MTRARTISVLLAMLLIMPALTARPAQAKTIKTPVLLVHGLNDDSATFGGAGWTKGLSDSASGPRRFKLFKGKPDDLFGKATPVYVLDYRGYKRARGDITTSAQAVDWAIGQIKGQTGAKKVFLVVHSMGGLLTRVYLEGLDDLKYRKDVAGFVTLSTPHMGCELADNDAVEPLTRLFAGWTSSRAGQQMDPDSDFLKKLNATDYVDPTVPSTFVVGNHYPLLGDGLLTAWEQIPYMMSKERLHRLTDYRIQFVDAVHCPKTALAWRVIEKAAGSPASSLRPIVETQEARAIAKAAYDRVATEYEAKPAAPKDSLHSPKPGSAERKAILDGLRPVIERDLGQEVIFEVQTLTVKDGFAFAGVTPRMPSGAKIDYTKTRYRQLLEEGLLDGGSDASIYALLRYKSSRWQVLTFVIGPTDVAYAQWWSEFGAPKVIFPYTE